MEAEDNKTKLIESYLDGSLSEKEREGFEDEMKTNTLLRKEVELHRLMHKAIRKKGRDSLRTELNELYKKEVSEKGNLKIIWTIASIAAAITILFLVFRGNDKEYFRNYEEITLDSTKINTIDKYADSATFDSMSNDNIK